MRARKDEKETKQEAEVHLYNQKKTAKVTFYGIKNIEFSKMYML